MRRLPELIIVTVGIALRFSMWRFDPRFGYDSGDHLRYIGWFENHWALPPLMLCRETYHPPLYYFIAGMLGRLPIFVHSFGLTSIIFGNLTLLLVWIGLERHLTGHRLARLVALTLAAVLPASVHLAGMMSAEGLNGFLSVAALLIAAEIFANRVRHPLKSAAILGAVLGLAMLTKISALVIVAAIAITMAIHLWWHRGSPGGRARRVTPWLVVFASFSAVSGWYFVRNEVLYDKPVLTGFDGVDGPPAADLEGKAYLDRRTLGFLVGWSNKIFQYPFYPTAVNPTSRFWPVLIASTFADYYNYAFIRLPKESPLSANSRLLRPSGLKFARASIMGGAMIAVATVAAWLRGIYITWRQRDAPRLVLLLAPALALAGQLHFAVRYPVDAQGPTKGVYLQFASPPLMALFGLAVAWLAEKPTTRPLAALNLVALLIVAVYTVYSRLT